MSFETATWYDNWNETGLNNLVQGLVPLNYATRYNMAFGEFVQGSNGYTAMLNQPYASQVVAQIRKQAAAGVLIYAGLGDSNIQQAVEDNRQNNNRSTANTVAWLWLTWPEGMLGSRSRSRTSALRNRPRWHSANPDAFISAE